jgi:hypothetical protein
MPTPDPKDELDRLRRRSRAIAVACNVGAVAVFGLVMLRLVFSSDAGDEVLVGRGVLAGGLSFAVLLLCLYAWDRKKAYDAITSSDYSVIAMLLELRPELEGYRQSVVAEGREFTRIDIEVMSRYHAGLLRWEMEEFRRKEARSVKAKIYRLTRVKKD